MGLIFRKALLIGLICGFMGGTGYAQGNVFKKELSVGGSFGTTFSYVSFMPKVQHGMKMGYT